MSARAPFAGRYYGIWNVEGDTTEPVALFISRDSAERELDRRRTLDADDDDLLDEYDQVFPCDIVGAWWNSYEEDPRSAEPLTPEETIAAYEGRS